MPDESNAYADFISRMIQTSQHEVVVPDIWWLELVNVLLVGERRGRINQEETQASLAFLRQIPLTVYPTTSPDALNRTLFLGRQHNLAAYDAAYLELALREQTLLATIDTRFSEVARSLEILLEDPIIQ
jgi:predicted nucleic acid-binding protein